MSLQARVWSTIQRPVKQVFEAVVDPKKMTGYFISEASEPMAEGASIIWEFADYNVSIEVKVEKVIPCEYISFDWSTGGFEARVEMIFKAESDSSSSIEIIESSFEKNNEGIAKVIEQTQGWTDFTCGLKAYLYTGINLRNGKYN